MEIGDDKILEGRALDEYGGEWLLLLSAKMIFFVFEENVKARQ